MKKLVDTFNKLSAKVKVIFFTILGFFGFITLFFINKKINAKEVLELELKNVKSQIKIKQAEAHIESNDILLSNLEQKASIIKSEIEEIKLGKKPEIISEKELDLFFKQRGF